MLMDHETTKLRSAEEAHQAEMREWRQELKPRKQVRMRPVFREVVSDIGHVDTYTRPGSG